MKISKKTAISEEKRAQTNLFSEEGYSEHQISIRLGVSKTAVHQAIAKFQKYGIYTDRKRSGRPLKTSSRDDHIIKKIALQSPLSSSKKIHKELLQAGVNISRSTVSHRLNMMFGLKPFKPAQNPRLTPPDEKEALALPKLTIAGHQRIKVLFSDESSVQQFSVRQPSEEQYYEKYTVLTVKQPPSQMVWGAMSAAGTGKFYFLTPGTTINDEKYVKVLQEKLQLHMTVHQCDIFMHDGVPCHRSRVVKKFLGEKNI